MRSPLRSSRRTASTPAAAAGTRSRPPAPPEASLSARVLDDLESARRNVACEDAVPPTMSIRELRRRFPATIPVLARYGLGDCGGPEGPDEPLAWFATVHRLPLEEFLRDVRRAAASEPPRPGRPPRRRRPRSLRPAFHPRLARPDADARRDHRNGEPASDRRGRRCSDLAPPDSRAHSGSRLRDALPHGDRVPRPAPHPRHRRRARPRRPCRRSG